MNNPANTQPKISCLCITRNRVELLKKSIQLFNNQTYPKKELVVVYLSCDQPTHELLTSITDDRIKLVEVADAPDLTLGDLRNISVMEASGDYICIWDDDDWFHPERLSYQLGEIVRTGKKASMLLNLLILDSITGEAYISNKWLWEGSMMCARQYILENHLVYPSINRREDTYFVKKISFPEIVIPLRQPKMYIYCYTGENTCGQNHFKKLFSLGKRLSDANSKLIKRIYNQAELDSVAISLLDEMEWPNH